MKSERYTRLRRGSRRKIPISIRETRNEINVSVMCSIYNGPHNERGELLGWSLRYLFEQNLPPNSWELVLVDDASPCEIFPAYQPFIGKINITHIKMDHRNHPIWKEMNPGKRSFDGENWPHTPGLSTNIAAKNSRGRVLCFTQPEICPSPNALKQGFTMAYRKKQFVFTELILTPPKFREDFLKIGYMFKFPEIWNRALGSLPGTDPVQYKAFHPGENYWMFAFLDKTWFMKVNGVDEEFQRGVYAEDDNFRNRQELIGVQTFRDRSIYAVHLNTEHEAKSIIKQQRDRDPWLSWARTNRERQANFLLNPAAFGNHLANIDKDWGSDKCIIDIERFPIS